MKIIIYLIVNTAAVLAAAAVLPGISVNGWTTAAVVALVLGALNYFVRPILVLLTLPATVITMGLFLLVINAVIVLLAAWLVPGFRVDGFLWALLFSLTVTLVSSFLLTLTN